MILIICAWIYCFVLGLSLGAGLLKLISRFSGISLNAQFGIFYQFWFGFAFLIGLLQLISLFLPVGNAAFIMLSLLAAFFIALNFRRTLAKTVSFYRWLITPKGFLSFLAVVIMLLLVSYAANKEVTHSDAFIYHFNAVKWAKDYPAVPGLVNLHNRLGFNSSFFLFAAFTEVGLYTGQSAHVTLSFLMVTCLIHWFFVISNPLEVMAKRIFCMMTCVFLLAHIFYRMDIASLSTDYPMAVLTLVFCLVLLDGLDHKFLLLLPISAVIFSFKLSGMLVIGISLIILAGHIFLLKYSKNINVKKGEVRLLSTAFVLLCFVFSGFVIRNVIVSGWLVYPFPLGNLHLPWSVPEPYVLDMIDEIKSYPKLPGGASPETIRDNSFFFWFYSWYDKFKQSTESFMLASALLVLFWAGFQTSAFAKYIYSRLNIALLIFFAIVSIVFWFSSAPDLRFGSIYFYILFAISIVVLFEGSRHKDILKVIIFIGFIYQVAGQVPAYYIDRVPNLFTFAYTKPLKLKRVIASPPGENPALYIYMPVEGNQCGNSPIPCTPYAGGLLDTHQFIRQRVPGNLSKGFLPPEHPVK